VLEQTYVYVSILRVSIAHLHQNKISTNTQHQQGERREGETRWRGVRGWGEKPSGISSAKTIQIMVPAAHPSPKGKRNENHSTNR